MENRYRQFNANIQTVLEVAEEEARRYGLPVMQAEHILLGLARVQSTVAARVLADLGVSLEALRAAVEVRSRSRASDARKEVEQQRCGVSLHLQGDDLPLDEIADLLQLTPKRIGRKGEPFYPDRPDLAKLGSHAWDWEAPAASNRDLDGFEELLAPLLTTLEAHEAELRDILDTPQARGWLSLSYTSPGGPGVAVLSSDTVRRIGSLGLEIKLVLSPPMVIDDISPPPSLN